MRSRWKRRRRSARRSGRTSRRTDRRRYGASRVAARMTIRIKRAYEPPAPGDGYRVLIDRLWPRGLRREELRLDVWAKVLSPSDLLRRWFGHDPRRWRAFLSRYRGELRAPAAREMLGELARRARRGTLTLVYAARDEAHNNAVVVRAELARRLRSRARSRGGGAAGRLPVAVAHGEEPPQRPDVRRAVGPEGDRGPV